MRFCIEPEIMQLFPQFCRGIVLAAGIDNTRSSSEVENLLRQHEEKLRQDQAIPSNPNTGLPGTPIDAALHPRLLAWKDAYRKFGANPNKFTPSIVFLAKQVKAGKPIRSISPVVDAFNAISLKYLIPCGGDDVDSVERDMTLGLATSQESFAPLFKPEEMEHPEKGEVIYVNRLSGRVMCRRWNWRNADFSRLKPETRNLAINVDGMMPSISRQEIEAAAEELAELMRRNCGGRIAVRYLDAACPETDFEY